MSNGKTFSESTGLTLRKITSIVWFFLPLIFFMMLKPAFFQYEDIEIPPVAIEQDNCYIEEYYEYINETTCSLEITFNQRVYEGPVTVVFYDKSGRELETLVIPLTNADYYPSYGTKMVNSYFDVAGEVDSYEIIDYSDLQSAEWDLYDDNEYYEYSTVLGLFIVWACVRCFYVIPLVLSSLFLNCKAYSIYGHCVVVYAGRLHHYIKVDGRKYDEKNTLISFSAITLTAQLLEGDKIEVYIPSFTKRMSLRVNGILEEPVG
jgi:hypothetical protein